MKKKLLIIKNISHESMGLLANVIQENNIFYDIIDLSLRQDYPNIEEYHAIIVFGGPDSANNLSRKMETQLIKIQEILKMKIPYLGICLGFQLLAKAAKAKVIPCYLKEVGLHNQQGESYFLHLTKKGRSDSLLNQLNLEISLFQLHGETIQMNDDIELLATSKDCVNQIIKVGTNAYGIQSHFELSPEMLDIWILKDADLQEMDVQQMRADFLAQYIEYKKNGLLLFSNFFKLAGFISS